MDVYVATQCSFKQIFVQLPTSANNMALPAFAAAAAGSPAAQQSIDIFWPPGPQQQTRNSGVRRADGTHRQTGGRTPYRDIDAAA